MDLCSPDFALLPAHIITRVLMYLELKDFKNASSTCKSWYYASNDPQIVRNLILQPKNVNLSEICQSNRRYGILKLNRFKFDKMDSHFAFFDKFCPFVTELQITNSKLDLQHLLKLLQLMTRLKSCTFTSFAVQLIQLSSLFPVGYDADTKNRIIKNLSGIKSFKFSTSRNIPMIVDLIRYTTNLESFTCVYRRSQPTSYEELFSLFDNDNIGNLKHLNLNLIGASSFDDFIRRFGQIKYLNLKSFQISYSLAWEDSSIDEKRSLYQQFVLKLQSLEHFIVNQLNQGQLSLICQHLVNLKRLDCYILDKEESLYELVSLKQLEVLQCRHHNSLQLDYIINFVELDKFFKIKFEYLRIFTFEGFVTESNLIQFCENHPNLIDLRLERLLTRNLEIIFQYLLKLRVLHISFGVLYLSQIRNSRSIVLPLYNLDEEYQYKLSRLQNLEEIYVSEPVTGIAVNEIKQLPKLRRYNFGNKSKLVI